MQSGREDTLEEWYAIKFCFKLGKNATETYGMLQTAFQPSCMYRAPVFEWHKRFKVGRESVKDDERCGRSKEVRTPELIGQIRNFMDKDRRVSRDNKCTVWCQCGNCTYNYLRGTEDAKDLCEVCPKGAQRRSERKMLSWQQGDGWADQFRSRSSWWWPAMKAGSTAMTQRPRPRQSSQCNHAGSPRPKKASRANPPTNFFWQQWHDLHALGSHWTDSQQGILCWWASRQFLTTPIV